MDAKRIYLVGYSSGGFMAYRLACDHADLFAGIISLAGATWLDATECRPTSRVSVLQIHGEDDAEVLFDGEMGGDRPGYPGALGDLERWADYNRCSGALDAPEGTFNLGTDDVPSFTAPQRRSGCSEGIDVELWKIAHGSHRPTLGEEFSKRTWAWLQLHPKQ